MKNRILFLCAELGMVLASAAASARHDGTVHCLAALAFLAGGNAVMLSLLSFRKEEASVTSKLVSRYGLVSLLVDVAPDKGKETA